MAPASHTGRAEHQWCPGRNAWSDDDWYEDWKRLRALVDQTGRWPIACDIPVQKWGELLRFFFNDQPGMERPVAKNWALMVRP